ncbi:hypothetical protein DS884_09765 [Tenacibaculum sp. E3R01]|uniref:ShlB/FhaC/HecB family hemolysin secretion/activation protein n=1 Tax=Tenacibaculum sp. E3R01 TaxID=2267227 RepID=UPI000DEB67BD|nr:hypothetical protein [Tenacibaculum sp. E3R01]RBW58141.1 hypothetical protein DS884_09765 [Tenacibaculum sp. E3R01]
MKRHTRTYILFTFLFIIFETTSAQEFNLNVFSKDSIEDKVLKKIKFKQKHLSKKNLLQEISKISNNLKSIGYFNHNYHLNIKNKKFNYLFKLNNKTNTVALHYKNKNIFIKTKELKEFLLNETKELDNLGNSFSSIKLDSIHLKGDTLFANVKTTFLKKRFIDKTVIKGYTSFPNTYIKNYLNINNRTTISKEKLSKIDDKLKSINFIKSIKKPELLFSKDSTILFLYLKKESKSNFDGIINFTSEGEKKGFKLNGHINLLLNNTLNSGETFKISWKSFNKQNESIELFSELPYIFNTPLTPSMSFKLHKQDSTFLNSKFNSKIAYTINHKSTVAITYNSTNSTNTLQLQNSPNINDYSNYFIGISYIYNIKNNKTLFTDKHLLFKVTPLFGNRSSNKQTHKQLKIKSEIEKSFTLNNRNSLYIKNEIGYLESKKYLINELFRIGGANSVRGFNEQSFFTKKYTFINTEYRYITSKNSQLYILFDYAYLKNINNKTNHLTSLGIGYKQLLKNTLINIEYSIGKSNNNSFNLNNSFLSLKLSNYF